VICRTLSFCTISDTPQVQKLFLESCLGRLVPLPMIKLILQMAMQNAGETGTDGNGFLSNKAVKDITDQNEIWELGREVLSQVLESCAKMRYDILELFSSALVTGSMTIRPYFLSALLQQTTQGEERQQLDDHFKSDTAVQRHRLQKTVLASFASTDTFERTLKSFRAEVYINGIQVPVEDSSVKDPSLYCVVSSKGFYIIDATSPGFPEKPKISRYRQFCDMTRLVRGAPHQMLCIGFASDGGVETEDFFILVCHRETDRNEVLGLLHALSAPPGGNYFHRVPLQTDPLFRQALEEINAETALLVTFAEVPVNQSVADLGPFGATRESAIFVLSETELSSFRVKFEKWSPLAEERRGLEEGDDEGAEEEPTTTMGRQALADTDTQRKPLDVNAILKHGEDADSTFAENLTKQRQLIRRPPNPDSAAAVESLLYSQRKRELKKLQKVAFAPDKRPKMILSFSDGSENMMFFDDTTRESWRRLLMKQLCRLDSAENWVREFRQGSDLQTS